MKLWEVLKAIEEGSTCVYVHDSGENPNIAILRKYADGWSKVKQPVTWQEAVEAWMNGKTIRCTMQGSDFVFDGYKPKLRDQIDTIGRIQLKEGTWYIED